VLAPKVRWRGVIADAELPKWYAAVDALANRNARALFLFMLFTGIRRTQARTMRWENVDLDRRVLRFTAAQTKGKRDVTLPISDYVHDLLAALLRDGTSPYVFWGHGGASGSQKGCPVGTRFPHRQVEGRRPAACG
jgi:integrase